MPTNENAPPRVRLTVVGDAPPPEAPTPPTPAVASEPSSNALLFALLAGLAICVFYKRRAGKLEAMELAIERDEAALAARELDARLREMRQPFAVEWNVRR